MIDQFRGEYFYLSNFFIEPDGTCVEVEFQALKGLSIEEMHYVMRSYEEKKPARESKRRGHEIKLVNDQWDEWLAYHSMSYLVLRKFLDHAELAEKLVATHGPLIEGNTWGDTTWGQVKRHGEWVGKNQLGEILMLVRNTLRYNA